MEEGDGGGREGGEMFATDHIPQSAAAAASAAIFTALESSMKLTLSGREGRGHTAG